MKKVKQSIKPLKIGFLVSYFVDMDTPIPPFEDFYTKLTREVIYDWDKLEEYMKNGGKSIYSKKLFDIVKLISLNETLIKSVNEFRRRFNIPADGFPINESTRKELEKLEKNKKHQKTFEFERLLAPKYRKSAKKYLIAFINTHEMPFPLQHQMDSIFYAGFVSNSLSTALLPVCYYNPLKEFMNDKDEIKSLNMLPIRIYINNPKVKLTAVLDYIKKNWDDIMKRTKNIDSISNIKLDKDQEKILLERIKGKPFSKIARTLKTLPTESSGLGSTLIAKRYRRLRDKANGIIKPK